MGFFSSLRRGYEQGRQGRDLPETVAPPPAPVPVKPPDGAEATLPAGISFAPGLDVVIRGQIKEAHAVAGTVFDSPPPPIPGRSYRTVDVAGTWTRAVAGSWHFEDTVKALPLGPCFVTLRLEPNDANPYGISAYVAGQQVGWLSTEWVASDKWVRFVTRLDEVGILPRLQAQHRLTDNDDHHIINFDCPGRDEGRLGDISRRIILNAAQQGGIS